MKIAPELGEWATHKHMCGACQHMHESLGRVVAISLKDADAAYPVAQFTILIDGRALFENVPAHTLRALTAEEASRFRA